MESFLQIILYAGLLMLSPVLGAVHTGRCGPALEDIPDPASDSCAAFFRCYNNRQFSIRCPLGQAFHFDRARCRPKLEVDCPLQLQRFQAPAVPHYLRPNQAHHEREVEIRVIHAAPNTIATNNQVFNNGKAPTLRQSASQQILSNGQFLQPPAQVGSLQAPVFLRTSSGQVIQVQGAVPHFIQPPALQNMAAQGVHGQYVQYPSHYNLPSQSVLGQNMMSSKQSVQGPGIQGQNRIQPLQNPPGLTVQNLNIPLVQQNAIDENLPSPPHQSILNQSLPNRPPLQSVRSEVLPNTSPHQSVPREALPNPSPHQSVPSEVLPNLPPVQSSQSVVLPNPPPVNKGQQPPSSDQRNSSSQLESGSNLAIFSPSSDVAGQSG